MGHEEGPGVGFVQKLATMGICDESLLFNRTERTKSIPSDKSPKKDKNKTGGIRASLSMDELSLFANRTSPGRLMREKDHHGDDITQV